MAIRDANFTTLTYALDSLVLALMEETKTPLFLVQQSSVHDLRMVQFFS